MEAASVKYRNAPDVTFHPSHALLLKILTNIVAEPEGKLLLPPAEGSSKNSLCLLRWTTQSSSIGR